MIGIDRHPLDQRADESAVGRSRADPDVAAALDEKADLAGLDLQPAGPDQRKRIGEQRAEPGGDCRPYSAIPR